jgi:hypothetical protein
LAELRGICVGLNSFCYQSDSNSLIIRSESVATHFEHLKLGTFLLHLNNSTLNQTHFNSMKNKILLTMLFFTVAGNVMNAQNWKEKISIIDGDTVKSYTILSELPTNTISLRATVIGTDTSFYFLYRNNEYQTINSYETTTSLNSSEMFELISNMHKVSQKVIDDVSYRDIRISKMMGGVIIWGKRGWNMLRNNRIIQLEQNVRLFAGKLN